MQKHIIPFSLLIVCISLIGCGTKDERTKVSGKVTVGGKNPLPGGVIKFVSVANAYQIAAAPIKSDGTFELLDAPMGECKVVVDNTSLNPNRKSNAPTMGPPGKGPKAPADSDKKAANAIKGAPIPPGMGGVQGDANQKYVPIDPAFTLIESTPLVKTVTKDATIDVDVK